MKIINVKQGSPEWLAWRKTVITATDCPAIRGSNPWVTPYKCWQKKLGFLEEQKSTEAMERGSNLEPQARAKFIEEYNINMVPVAVESAEFDFMGASLDGLSDCQKFVLEVKCGGAKLHEMALKGEIPQYYQDQMQHQLLVTGAEKAFYYSYNGTSGVCIEVLPDPAFKSKWVAEAREFWKCVAMNEAPRMQNLDYTDMSDNSRWKQLAPEYKRIDEQIKTLEELKKSYRKELLTLCGDQSCKGEGIMIIKSTPKGAIDYGSIPQLEGVDLNNYRKPSTTKWTILVA